MLTKSLLLILFIPVLAYSMDDYDENNPQVIGKFNTPPGASIQQQTPNHYFKIEVPNEEMIVTINLGTPLMRFIGGSLLMTHIIYLGVKLKLAIDNNNRKQTIKYTKNI
jgi:hypothetical protein